MEIVFERDLAVLAAQLSALLVVAFVVEIRAVGSKRGVDERDAWQLPLMVFSPLVAVLIVAAIVMLTPGGVEGPLAVWLLVVVGVAIAFLVSMVWLAAWAALAVTGREAAEERRRRARVDRWRKTPGWRWFIAGTERGATSHPDKSIAPTA